MFPFNMDQRVHYGQCGFCRLFVFQTEYCRICLAPSSIHWIPTLCRVAKHKDEWVTFLGPLWHWSTHEETTHHGRLKSSVCDRNSGCISGDVSVREPWRKMKIALGMQGLLGTVNNERTLTIRDRARCGVRSRCGVRRVKVRGSLTPHSPQLHLTQSLPTCDTLRWSISSRSLGEGSGKAGSITGTFLHPFYLLMSSFASENVDWTLRSESQGCEVIRRIKP